MTRIGSLNLAATAVALTLSAWLALPDRVSLAASEDTAPTREAGVDVVSDAQGRPGLRDASGHFVPLASYQRIASTSGVTDSLLLALAEPQRIVAFTRFSAEQSPQAYRYAGKPTLVDISNVEAIVTLKPDLVLVNSLGGAARIDRLRAAGLCVFDLGEMRGTATLLPNILSVATLVGRPEVGKQLAHSFERRMRALAEHVPESERPRGLYLSIYGDSIYGGGPGTNYHDVLIAAGLRDAAEPKYREWARYTPEALLELDPDVIVTHPGMKRTLCERPGFERLRACGRRGGVLEVSGALLDDPGLVMLDAAEAVFERVHPASQ